MTRINLKFPGLILIFSIVILQLNCSKQEKKEGTAHAFPIVDTLNYEKTDYDLMREYFSSDTFFLLSMNRRIQAGDTTSVKMKKLLTTEYESRNKTGITESQIDALIFSYYARKNVTDKFKEIESRLPKTSGDADAVRRQTDSLINIIEAMKQEVKEN